MGDDDASTFSGVYSASLSVFRAIQTDLNVVILTERVDRIQDMNTNCTR